MARWLFVCAAMILAMVVIGGITRLTESVPFHHRMEAADRRRPTVV
jgi:hypothetical protein